MTNDTFREACRVYLRDDRGKPIAKNIDELRTLMRLKRFNEIRDKAGNFIQRDPTNEQVSYAWKYLKSYSQVSLDEFLQAEKLKYPWGEREKKRDPITGRFDKRGSRSKRHKAI